MKESIKGAEFNEVGNMLNKEEMEQRTMLQLEETHKRCKCGNLFRPDPAMPDIGICAHCLVDRELDKIKVRDIKKEEEEIPVKKNSLKFIGKIQCSKCGAYKVINWNRWKALDDPTKYLCRGCKKNE